MANHYDIDKQLSLKSRTIYTFEVKSDRSCLHGVLTGLYLSLEIGKLNR